MEMARLNPELHRHSFQEILRCRQQIRQQ